jgi:hypothetical protein
MVENTIIPVEDPGFPWNLNQWESLKAFMDYLPKDRYFKGSRIPKEFEPNAQRADIACSLLDWKYQIFTGYVSVEDRSYCRNVFVTNYIYRDNWQERVAYIDRVLSERG